MGGGDLKGFAIRGSTCDWVWATGKMDGQDIVVWNDQVPEASGKKISVSGGWGGWSVSG